MKTEIIELIEIMADKELLLKLKSGGNPVYQYIYREAVSLSWDDKLKGFKSMRAPRNLFYPEWFTYIVGTVKQFLDIELQVTIDTKWSNIDEDIKNQILKNCK